MTKLYRAYTVRENYKGRDSVIVDWFCSERKEPVTAYGELIENYGDLDEKERERAEKLIDHFLTGQEVDGLQRYMRKYFGFEVKSREVEIPFKNGRKIYNFSEPSDPSHEGEYFDLAKNEDYDLDVPIKGFVDLSEPPNLISYIKPGE